VRLQAETPLIACEKYALDPFLLRRETRTYPDGQVILFL